MLHARFSELGATKNGPDDNSKRCYSKANFTAGQDTRVTTGCKTMLNFVAANSKVGTYTGQTCLVSALYVPCAGMLTTNAKARKRHEGRGSLELLLLSLSSPCLCELLWQPLLTNRARKYSWYREQTTHTAACAVFSQLYAPLLFSPCMMLGAQNGVTHNWIALTLTCQLSVCFLFKGGA